MTPAMQIADAVLTRLAFSNLCIPGVLTNPYTVKSSPIDNNGNVTIELVYRHLPSFPTLPVTYHSLFVDVNLHDFDITYQSTDGPLQITSHHLATLAAEAIAITFIHHLKHHLNLNPPLSNKAQKLLLSSP